jgi:hypothetical protein
VCLLLEHYQAHKRRTNRVKIFVGCILSAVEGKRVCDEWFYDSTETKRTSTHMYVPTEQQQHRNQPPIRPTEIMSSELCNERVLWKAIPKYDMRNETKRVPDYMKICVFSHNKGNIINAQACGC